MKIAIIILFACLSSFGYSQKQNKTIDVIEEINIDLVDNYSIQNYWLKMTESGMSQPILVPIIIAKGSTDTVVLGLTAALHGNELNGIKVIQELIESLDITQLNGTIIAIPGLNSVSIPLHERRFVDEEDLNRDFPGKAKGNRSQQYAYQITTKILSKIDYLVDMHTASFGRTNSLYVRADMNDTVIRQMALVQDADIILNNKGIPSAGDQIAATRTMRAEAVLAGKPAITIEYGNPQVYQPDMIRRGVIGIHNILTTLGMTKNSIIRTSPAVQCKKSYWIFLDQGGYLENHTELKEKIKKDQLIANLRNPFGDIIQQYYAPEDGIVIGQSSNPINMTGGRILHLGIID